MMGGKFISGFASGAISSLVASAFQFDYNGKCEEGLGWADGFRSSKEGAIAFATVSGGVASELTGGNFWMGAAQGFMVSALNHSFHDNDDIIRINSKDKSATIERTSDDYDRIFVDGKEVMAMQKGVAGPLLEEEGFSFSIKLPRGVKPMGMGLTDLTLNSAELLSGAGLVKMGLTTTFKSSITSIRAMKAFGASSGTLRSSVFFTKHIGSKSLPFLKYTGKYPTLYKPAATWGTFLGRNSPIIGGGMMFHSGYNILNQ